ncbi:MAG: ATP-dependent sacrificial sulfur transferase LarE [Planctomycetes bacterium]|nr:ATP-dependent sacrificial sulfur transferase LarE [Planctomycetota bacterium]
MSARPAALDDLLASFPDLVVAFSGGVDSSVLLHSAVRVLGARAVALIGDSPSLPRRELAEAEAFAARLGARLERLATDELALDGYRANDGQRCYFCRHTLFASMESWARAHGFTTLAYGEITDDLSEPRPGRRAAAELDVRAPLREAGFSKADVRAYARAHELVVAEKPAAACLSSRLPLGTPVTRAALARIEAAEEALRPLGFALLRVRDHGPHARVEVAAEEHARACSLEAEFGARLAAQGFTSLELAVYRRGEQATTSPAANSTSR